MEYLYHYTSVESLAQILKNKTIKFNSLNNMDDLQESKTAHANNFGQYCLVSSWTNDEKEHIPMWSMYTPHGSGVRIKMRKTPFKEKENTPDTLSYLNLPIVNNNNEGTYLKSLILLGDLFKQKVVCVTNSLDGLLHEVKYTDDESLLYPNIIKIENEKIEINYGKMGEYKNAYWKFQNEWRYILRFYPFDMSRGIGEAGVKQMSEIAYLMLHNQIRLPFDSYFLEINDEAFNDIEILLSPTISAGNKILVQCLINELCPNAIIKDSKLTGLIS